MFEDYRITLASNSPRRRELLSGLGLVFTVEPSKDGKETYGEDIPNDRVPEFLALHKSDSFHRPLEEREVLITADTLVFCPGTVSPDRRAVSLDRRAASPGQLSACLSPGDVCSAQLSACPSQGDVCPAQLAACPSQGTVSVPDLSSYEILGKPKDRAEAVSMLKRLSGKSHYVLTGVALRTLCQTVSFTSATEVTFVDMDDKEIDFYIDRYSPYDKAGAYGVQEWIGFAAISSIRGSYFNVMGLPVHRLYAELKKMLHA